MQDGALSDICAIQPDAEISLQKCLGPFCGCKKVFKNQTLDNARGDPVAAGVIIVGTKAFSKF